jgi:hypothetical protein
MVYTKQKIIVFLSILCFLGIHNINILPNPSKKKYLKSIRERNKKLDKLCSLGIHGTSAILVTCKLFNKNCSYKNEIFAFIPIIYNCFLQSILNTTDKFTNLKQRLKTVMPIEMAFAFIALVLNYTKTSCSFAYAHPYLFLTYIFTFGIYDGITAYRKNKETNIE